ncbi:MAG: TonB-dependent siderophore receptor [Alphaproteobacteria bacterium]|nr:TonB-dependent siderophore receptor [Alphaproteobacteria bacterium]MDB5721980.1 TonB-dependent siderophore receptor [Alphaproteobacteria bacterium]
MLRTAGLILSSMLAVGAMPAQAASYGDTLLADTARRHREIVRVEIVLTGPKADVLRYARGGAQGFDAAPTIVALNDGLGDPIGRVALTLRTPDARRAQAIAGELSRHIYTAAVLTEPDPFVSGVTRSPAGQALVERLLVRHPGLVTLALHVALPGRPNRILASNFGRIGKPADDDDRHVIAETAVLKEMTNAGRRLAVELPLLDRHGRTIGALSTSFLLGSGGIDSALVEAIAVRNALARAIPSIAMLGH